MPEAIPMQNFNVGLMGHVDSGKTSLAIKLSSMGSTAAFDKSPQSQARGITLDLGFSTFSSENTQITLVDCPGHASLIRTVLCGAQIIDAIVLVIDAGKGIQVQTAECLIVAEIVTDRVIFVLNKIDQWDWSDSEKQERVSKTTMKLRTALKSTKFSDSLIIPVSACSGEGIETLRQKLLAFSNDSQMVRRVKDEDFLFVVDHCFPIKGHGSVLTGTVLSGQISLNENVEIVEGKTVRKVKSIQSFKRAVTRIEAGDRAGICMHSIEAAEIERTLVCSPPGSLQSKSIVLMSVNRVKYFKDELKSKSRLHFTILNSTVLAKRITFLRQSSFGFEYLEALDEGESVALIEFERPVFVIKDAIVIAVKLDSEPTSQKCRIAFHGRLLRSFDELEDVKVFRVKERLAQIDRIIDENRIIGKDLVKVHGRDAANSVSRFIGMKISLLQKLEIPEVISVGRIESLFGSSGKFNVSLVGGLQKHPQSLGSLFLRLSFVKLMYRKEKTVLQVDG